MGRPPTDPEIDHALVQTAAILFRTGKAPSKDAALLKALKGAQGATKGVKAELERLRKVADPIWIDLVSNENTAPVFVPKRLNPAQTRRVSEARRLADELRREAARTVRDLEYVLDNGIEGNPGDEMVNAQFENDLRLAVECAKAMISAARKVRKNP